MSKPLGPTDIKRLNRSWRRRTEESVALMLCALSNPFNTGSIIRSAAVFGVDTLYLYGATPEVREASVQKMAMGTDKHLEIVRIEDIAQVRKDGYSPVALELTADAVPLHEAKLSSPVCLILGNEAHGLPASIIAASDATVYIPQPGKVASLNVAVSAAVALHELRRREWSEQGSDFPMEEQ